MKIKVLFKSLNNNGKKYKKLGKFWKQNEDFIIELETNQDNKNKMITFTEELLHLLFYILQEHKLKKISLKDEHRIIHDIITLLTINKLL